MTKNNNLSKQSRLREIFNICLFSAGIFLLIAFLSFSKNDPGWSSTSFHYEVQNKTGVFGAFISDLILYLFGVFGYLIPVALIIAPLFNGRKFNITFAHILGIALFLTSICAMVSTIYLQNLSWLPFTTGGVYGDFIGFSLVQAFNFYGAQIILAMLGLCGIVLFSGIPVKDILMVLVVVGNFILRILGKILAIRKLFTRKTKAISVVDSYKAEEPEHESIAQKEETKPSLEEKEDPEQEEEPEEEPKPTPVSEYKGLLPHPSLLNAKKKKEVPLDINTIEYLTKLIENKLKDFGIIVAVKGYITGPVVTRFELDLAPGIKASRITALAKDLARSMSLSSVRVVEVVPGKSFVALEVPNNIREKVNFREVIESQAFADANNKLTIALGKDIAGKTIVADLAKMPHLLVAGTTGSGKSVGINTLLLSLLFKYNKDQVKLILIDPKMLELSVYKDIGHLLTPVVTDMKEAAQTLNWCVSEMERRYMQMTEKGVRNISGYNSIMKDAKDKLPYIVVVIDEFADMIMVVGKKVEQLIARIAQKARAAGIHLVLATQRPSVDVITGLIKSNIPARISFQVSSRIDSRTILDQQGAEHLLGNGDMLYLPSGMPSPIRVHGAYVSDTEVNAVADFVRSQSPAEYIDDIKSSVAELSEDKELDELYHQAVEYVRSTKKASISSIQRKFRIGYNRAASIVDTMEEAGVVSAMESNGQREVY